jgi:hypothetical protein
VNKQDKLKRCQDCEDNFYNHGGNSCSGQCWALDDAKPATVWVVGTWQERPAEHMYPIKRLSCWRPRRGAGLSVMKREVKQTVSYKVKKNVNE